MRVPWLDRHGRFLPLKAVVLLLGAIPGILFIHQSEPLLYFVSVEGALGPAVGRTRKFLGLCAAKTWKKC